LEDDWDLIEKSSAGDEAAFESLFLRHKNKVYGLALRFTRDAALSEDLVQEVFIRVHGGKVKRSPSVRFTTWLYRVTANLSIDAIRKRRWLELFGKESPAAQMPDPAPSAAQSLHDKERATILNRAIQRLPESLRFPLLLYSFQDLPYREIGLILGLTEKTVERRLYHAKKRLRNHLNIKFDL